MELELGPEKDLTRLNYLKDLPILLPKVGTCKHGGGGGLKAGALSPRLFTKSKSQVPPTCTKHKPGPSVE